MLSNRCTAVAHCGFNVDFSRLNMLSVFFFFFHLFICHLYIFFEVSGSFAHVFNWAACFLVMTSVFPLTELPFQGFVN